MTSVDDFSTVGPPELGVVGGNGSGEAVASPTAPLVASGVQWFKFNLPNDIIAASNQFLDVNTVGSDVIGQVDTEVGLYDASGSSSPAMTTVGQDDSARLVLAMEEEAATYRQVTTMSPPADIPQPILGTLALRPHRLSRATSG